MRRFVILLAGVALTTFASTAMASGFLSSSDLVVVRLGDGSAALSGANAVYLDEYNSSGTLVYTYAVPSSGSSALTLPGISDHDGQLNLSENGQYLLLGGYRYNAGSTDPSTLTAAQAPRVIGFIGATGPMNTTTALTDAYDNTSIRAVASVNGTSFYTAGDNAGGANATGGTHYVANVGATTSTNISQVQNTNGPQTPDNIRDINIFNGQLYNSSGSGASVGKSVFSVGVGLPTSGMQTLTPLLSGSDSITSFQFVHLNGGAAGYNTIYTSGADGIEKWSLSGSTWVQDGSSIGLAGNEDITVSVSGSTATLYVSSESSISKLTDSSGFGGALSGSFSTFATAGTNEEFRGLSFAPMTASVPEPSSIVLALAGLGAIATLRFARRNRQTA